MEEHKVRAIAAADTDRFLEALAATGTYPDELGNRDAWARRGLSRNTEGGFVAPRGNHGAEPQEGEPGANEERKRRSSCSRPRSRLGVNGGPGGDHL